METWIRDIRYAGRVFSRSKGVAGAAVLTLALGIGACTAIFSVVEGVLWRPLDYPQPDRILQIWQLSNTSGNRMQTSDPNFEEWKEQSRTIDRMAQYGSGVATVVGGTEPVRVRTANVSRDFFDIFGIQPRLGRAFVEEEMREGGAPAVVVSYGFWRRLLEEDPELSRRKLEYDGAVHNVVGVMPPGFDFPAGSEIWRPREQSTPRNPHRTGHNWRVVGRLRESASLELARSEMESIGRGQMERYGEDIWMSGIEVLPLHDQLVGDARPRLLTILGAVAFLLLVACSNVANLLMAQAASQQREMAVRQALGAGWWRLGRQFVTQSILLCLLGGGLGILLASWGIPALLALEPGDLPRTEGIAINLPVLAFSFGLMLLTALLLSLYPVIHFLGGKLLETLKEAGRGAGDRTGGRLRSALVVSQLAMTLILLTGAGLLGRSFLQLLRVDPGFRADGAVVMKLSNSFPSSDEEKARLAAFLGELMTRLKTIPGVQAVGGVDHLPLSGGFPNGRFMVEDNEQDLGYAEYRLASEGYFEAMGIPLKRGRFPSPSDDAQSPHVAVISQSLADQKWPEEDPIGKRIQFGNMDGDRRLLTIVGIVGDVLDYGLDQPRRGTVYPFYKQRPQRASSFAIVLLTSTDPAAVVNQARAVLSQLNPNLPPQFDTIAQMFSSSLADRRFSLILLGIFGAAALLLAGVGVFGVMAYSVSQRRQEIGVRMALGARWGDVFRLVLLHGMKWTGLGIAIGMAGSLVLGRTLSSLLFGVTASDPMTLCAAAGVLVAVTFAATYLPARRASSLDPLGALQR